jgi:hypothetical protein
MTLIRNTAITMAVLVFLPVAIFGIVAAHFCRFILEPSVN